MSYRFAVVGCGLMGGRHSRLLQETDGYELSAVCDADANRAEEAARQFQTVARPFEEILQDPAIHGLVLTLPSNLHAEAGLKAIEAGKHLIMEKPLATKPEDGRRLLAAARHAQTVLAVIAQNRFSDAALSLKQAIRAGQFGKLLLARATVKWHRHDQYYTGSDWRGRLNGEGGGVLMNQAVHSTDMLIHLLGRPQAVIALCARNRPVIDTEDTAVVLMNFPRHVLATIEASTSTWPGFEESYEIHGDAGYCVLKKGQLAEWSTQDGSPAPVPPPMPEPTVTDQKLVLFQRQYLNILDALNEGPEKLFVTPEESLWVVETTRLMYESASQLSNETVSF